jgi:hypothetical protein
MERNCPTNIVYADIPTAWDLEEMKPLEMKNHVKEKHVDFL